jgi:hypothetical protein
MIQPAIRRRFPGSRGGRASSRALLLEPGVDLRLDEPDRAAPVAEPPIGQHADLRFQVHPAPADAELTGDGAGGEQRLGGGGGCPVHGLASHAGPRSSGPRSGDLDNR